MGGSPRREHSTTKTLSQLRTVAVGSALIKGNDYMNSDELLGLFAEALEADKSSISMETLIADVPEWTSLVWLSIMSLLDERYGVQLSAREIRRFKTAGDVVECISTKIGTVG